MYCSGSDLLKTAIVTMALGLALVGWIGTSSAGATVLCTSNESCPTSHLSGGKMYVPGDVVTAETKLGSVTVTNALGNVSCSSQMKLKLTETGQEGSPIVFTATGEVTSLSFTGCIRNSEFCEVKALNLPYHFKAVNALGGNGSLEVRAHSGGSSPGMSVVCGFFINCTFSNVLFVYTVDGGAPASLTLKTAVSRSGGICPSEATLDADYTTSSALFVRN